MNQRNFGFEAKPVYRPSLPAVLISTTLWTAIGILIATVAAYHA